MKTKHYFVILIMTLLAGACSKEQLSPRKSENIHCKTDETKLKYSEDVIVYDQSHKFSVTYQIASDHSESVKAMKKDMEATTIKLLMKAPNFTNKVVDAKRGEKCNKQPVSDPKGIYLTEVDRNIGDAIGYSIEAIRQKDGYVESYSTITITVDFCAGLYISNQWVFANYNYHYWNDGISWYFDRMETLSFNQNYYFTAGGYSGHRIISQPSYTDSSINNRIYWVAL
nr:hypothetical protein [uncultured Fluviicola sp.]